MYILVDPMGLKHSPKQLSENGGRLLSVESRTGCEIRFGVEKFLYRGKEVRHVFIDGPTQNAIVCCQKALPEYLQKYLIMDQETKFTKEPPLPEPGPLVMERLGPVPVQMTA